VETEQEYRAKIPPKEAELAAAREAMTAANATLSAETERVRSLQNADISAFRAKLVRAKESLCNVCPETGKIRCAEYAVLVVDGRCSCWRYKETGKCMH